MSKAAMNLQDSFLNQVRRENSEVRVLLVNGTLLRGTVKGFDNFTLILNNRNGQHLIYKHAVAQIVTHRPHVRPEDLHAGDITAASETETSEITEASGTATPAEKTGGEKTGGRPHRQQGQEKTPRHDRAPASDAASRQKNKKEGFNTLDLSGVKLGETKEG